MEIYFKGDCLLLNNIKSDRFLLCNDLRNSLFYFGKITGVFIPNAIELLIEFYGNGIDWKKFNEASKLDYKEFRPDKLIIFF